MITLPDDRYEAYCTQHSDFIRKYIFPGGHLPSMGAMLGFASRVGLEFDSAVNLGFDYAVTLRLWRERMLARTEQARVCSRSERATAKSHSHSSPPPSP